MTLLECFVLLIIIIGNLMTLSLALKNGELIEMQDDDIRSLFKYITEVDKRLTELDSIVQRLEK